MYAWCAGDGFSVVSPAFAESLSLVLEGENELPGQVLTVTSQGRTLSKSDVPLGSFRLEIAFSQLLPPQTIVEFIPRQSKHLQEDENRYVSVLLRRFSFEVIERTEVEPLPFRRELVFGLRFAAAVEPLLRGGWSSLEPAHLWSIGAASHLLVGIPPKANELQLKLSGNPFVPEKRRRVSVSVNGSEVANNIQLTTAPKIYKLKVNSKVWRASGGNLISLLPDQTAQPPEDPRDLGVCLHSIQAW